MTVKNESDGADAALAEYMRRVDAGETVDREAFLAAHPEVAAELRSYFEMEAEVLDRAGPATSNPVDAARTDTHPRSQTDVGTVSDCPAAASTQGLPETFGRYKVVRKLGSGAMGTVYLAEDTLLGRRVALKTSSFDKDDSGEQRERFQREARSAATLRHSNICPVHDVGQIDGRHFISMAYIEGQPLSAYIKPGKFLHEKQVLMVIRKLALALQEAHDHGIVHRDLKPGNLMVDGKSEPIITDFGLARISGQSDAARLTQDGMILGSPAFMSPEQVEGDSKRITGATDQYSLGVILYEMLTGELPFRGPITGVLAAILSKDPMPPSQRRQGLNPRIEALCLKMMSKSPGDRFPNLKAVASEIAEILTTPSPVSTQPLAESHTGAVPATSAAAPSNPSNATIPLFDAEKAKPAPPEPAASRPKSPAAPPASPKGGSKPSSKAGGDPLTDESIASLVACARKLLDRHDYDQVIPMLEQVPTARRTEELEELLDRARSLSDEMMFLLTEIDEAIRRNDAETAVRKAADLQKIRPGHRRAKEVQEKYGRHGEGNAARGMRRDRRKGGPVGERGWNLWAVIAFGLAVFGLMLWSVTVYLKVGDAVVKVTINDPDITVGIKGHTLNITGAKEPVKVTPGDGTLKISYGDLEFQSETFTLKKGENPVVTIERLNDKLAAMFGDQAIGSWTVPVKPKDSSAATASSNGSTTYGPAPPSAVAPFDAAQAKAHQEAWAKHLGVPVEFTNSIGMKFRLIPPGEFQMGFDPGMRDELVRLKVIPADAPDEALKEATPRHRVRITRPFYLGVEDIQARWYREVMGELPGKNSSDLPEAPLMTHVSRLDAVAFCNKLSERERRTASYAIAGESVSLTPDGNGYRLPTEAEWEFACRAGTDTFYYFGNDPHDPTARFGKLKKHQRFTSGADTLPNPFGLFDMIGGSDEWCWDNVERDGYLPKPYSALLQAVIDDPVGREGDFGVKRGGSDFSDGGRDYWACNSVGRRPFAIGERNKWSGFGRVLLPIGSSKAATSPPLVSEPSSANAPKVELPSVDHAAERKAAEWIARVLKQGEAILVRENGSKVSLSSTQRTLPEGNFFVESVSTNACSIDDAGLSNLAGCRRLRVLEAFAEPGITAEGLKALGPSLRYLHLDHSHVDDSLWPLLARWPSLESLGLFSNDRITDAGLASMPKMPKLGVFNVGSCPRITDAGFAGLAGRCPNLGMLRIADFEKITKSFAVIQGMNRLETVGCTAGQITDTAIASIRGIPSLQIILVEDKASDAVIERLSGLGGQLKVLHFTQQVANEAPVTSRGYALLPKLVNVGELILRGNQGSPGDADLLQLAKMPKLHSLTLAFAETAEDPKLPGSKRLYTAAGIEAFCKARPDVALTIDGKQYAASGPVPAKKLAFQMPGFDQWVKDVAAMPADKQLEEVSKKLVELNPEFDGKLTQHYYRELPPIIEDGVVKEVSLHSDKVDDISPVRALTGLRHLGVGGAEAGQLSDLSPIAGMKLTSFECIRSSISDLSPLQGMPLTEVLCWGSKGISSLLPLKQAKLEYLHCSGTNVSDLSPLQGMPLTKGLILSDTPVSNLSPLAGIRLTQLAINNTRVADLSPLTGMPLATLGLAGTRVTDLSVLKGMPLKVFEFDFKPERDTAILRSLKTLETINGKPAAEFWKNQ